MPYDSNLDTCLAKKMWGNDDTRITVSIYSYNNGPKKMQVSRENRNAEGEYRFSKLGRMTKEEAEEVIPLMQEIVKEM